MFTVSRVRLLIITCATLFMAMLDNLVLGVALPSIQKSFETGITDLQWFTNAYTLAFAVLLIPSSLLGERFGRKKIFLTGVILFTLGSAFSGLSTNSMQLIFSRVVQGIGGASIVPLSLTLVSSAFPEDKRAAAMGIWSGISGLGLSVGPLIGGLILEGAPWQLIFWINVPVGVLAFLFGLKWLPEMKGEKQPVDLLGILLLAIGLFGIIYGLQNGNKDGWSDFFILGSITGGIILLVLFIIWERMCKQPLVQLNLFRKRDYSAFMMTGFLLNGGIFGSIFLLTLFLQQAQGYSALGAGAREMAWTGCTMIAAPLAGLLVTRLGTRFILSAGLFMQAIGLVGFSLVIGTCGADFPFLYIVPFMIIAGTGMGLSFTPLAHGVLASVPDSSAGEASGVSNATRELGGVFGIAICTLIFESGSAITSPDRFADHIVPSLLSGAGMLTLALIVVLLFVGRSKSRVKTMETIEPSAENAVSQ
ncbi:MFS transporter [Gorillibacterium massiliense]|uniref:MFS transporter n=1 Tax=Gorillibacterium massiliense TaxID=1280390 RepID=UPI0004ACB272|nr:MFS transporter [Gorillibacterium massiliense]